MGRNERGVALLIVLLVTTLLIALIFEFAYGTRVSLRAAMNFRDGERAALLARSGIAIFAKYQQLQDYIPQGQWSIIPVVSQGDTEVRVRWEDEAGKIRISDFRTGQVDRSKEAWFRELLTQTGVSQEVADRMFGDTPVKISLLSDLHQVMSDENYAKIAPYVTVYADSPGKININTASETVLKSVLQEGGEVGTILSDREDGPIQDLPSALNMTGNFTTTSTIVRVWCYATVGGYTKQAEAVVRSGNPYVILYWRML